MSRYIIKIISILILFSIIVSTHYSCWAKKETVNVDILDEGIEQQFNPNTGVSGTPKKLAQPFTNLITVLVRKILTIIQAIGALLTIVSIAIFGFYMVTTSNGSLSGAINLGRGRIEAPDTKVKLLEFGRNILIGAVLLLSSSTIVKFVFNIFT